MCNDYVKLLIEHTTSVVKYPLENYG